MRNTVQWTAVLKCFDDAFLFLFAPSSSNLLIPGSHSESILLHSDTILTSFSSFRLLWNLTAKSDNIACFKSPKGSIGLSCCTLSRSQYNSKIAVDQVDDVILNTRERERGAKKMKTL